ncbi:MAG: 23S rRNA (uracil(1939)-C(5))-methyltransferase RlmD [Clostridia bacterium]|nr:23S rRNA (uracil(1939)-C(5))-methyltransferase RlmD [Clostridia bacterium]
MKIGEIYKLQIVGTGVNGEGIAKWDKYVCFIPGALDGDTVLAKTVKIKKNIVFMRLDEVITPSPYRIAPPCKYFGECGGCTLLNTTYSKQISIKRDKVYQTIKRIGNIDVTPENVVECDKKYNYRNKALIPVAKSENGEIVAGFFKGKSHEVLDISDCMIQDKYAFEVVKIIKDWMKKFNIEPYFPGKTGVVRHIFFRRGVYTNEVMAGVVTSADELPYKNELVNMLKGLDNLKSVIHNINKSHTSVLMGDKTEILYGNEFIEDIILDKRFRIGPLSFYQVNPAQVQKLYGTAIELIEPGKDDVVFDIYCGVGTIGLCMADKVKKVYGIEIVPEAIEYAKENAKLNNINNAEFFVGKAEEKINNFINMENKPNVVVLDPPRAGCDRHLLDAVNEMQPEKVCYVSCDVATLARDLNILCNEYNYNVKKVVPVDMFAHSSHVETIAFLVKE